MICDLKRSVDLRWLFDTVLHPSLDDLVLKQMAKYDVLQTYKLFSSFAAFWPLPFIFAPLYVLVCHGVGVEVADLFIKVSDRRTLHDHSTISKFVSFTFIVIVFSSWWHFIISWTFNFINIHLWYSYIILVGRWMVAKIIIFVFFERTMSPQRGWISSATQNIPRKRISTTLRWLTSMSRREKNQSK